MHDANNTVTGGCLCGQLKYQFEKNAVITTNHCYCTDCQKSTGSEKATIVLINDASLQIDGEVKYYTVTGTDGADISRGFCEDCGSPVISYASTMDGIKFIKSGSLDESSWVEVTSNYWTSSANKWSKVDETITCFKQNPEF